MTLIFIAEPLLRYRGGAGMPAPTDEGEGGSISCRSPPVVQMVVSEHLRHLDMMPFKHRIIFQ